MKPPSPAPEMRRKRMRRQPDDARRALLEAVETVLEEGVPFRDISVAVLAERAGMRRSNFYHYFAGIDDAAVAILEGVSGLMVKAGSPWLDLEQGRNPLEPVRQGLVNSARLFRDRGRLLRAFDEASYASAAMRSAWRRKTMEEVISSVRTQLERQRAAGFLRDLDIPETARALVLMNNAVFMERLARWDPHPVEDVVDTLTHIWISTLYQDSVRDPAK